MINFRLRFLKFCFDRYGLESHHVANGQEAVTYAQAHQLDLVLIDINMPIMDGIEAAKAIRANGHGYKQPVIIAMSATNDKKMRENCFAAGMDDFLPKPYTPEQFIETIEQYLLVLAAR